MKKPETSNHLAETRVLVRKAKEGNTQALQTLFARYYDRIRLVVRARLGKELRQKLESEDIIQTAFSEVLHSLDHFECRTEGAFLHWLGTIVSNTIKDNAHHYLADKRGGEKKTLTGSSAEDVMAALPAAVRSPSEDASKREAEDRLYAALDILDEEKREVLFLSRFQHLSHKEIGGILGCSEDAARMRVIRAERELIEAYAKLSRGT